MRISALAATLLTLAILPVASARAEESAADPAWDLQLHGLLGAGFDSVADDERYDFIGRYDGFALRNARLILDATNPAGFSARLSIEGATDIESSGTTPAATLDARVRDGWLSYAPTTALVLRAGQFRPGFLAESTRDPEAYPFATASLLASGVALGAGFETPGLALDRGIGAEVNSGTGITAGDLTVRVRAGAWNGNGANQQLNDNPSVAFGGRIELAYTELVTIGAAGFVNGRTDGPLPDRYQESDTGTALDLRVAAAGFSLLAQAAQVATSYETVGSTDRLQAGWSAEAGYDHAIGGATAGLGYRIATLDPWADGSATRTHEEVTEQTVALRLGTTVGGHPARIVAQHTFVKEFETRSLNNDRTQVTAVVAF